MKFLTTFAVAATALTIGVTGVRRTAGRLPAAAPAADAARRVPAPARRGRSVPALRSLRDRPVGPARRGRCGLASGLAGRAPGRRRGGRADRGRRLPLQLGERRCRRARCVARRRARRRRRLCDARAASPRAPLSQEAKRRLFRTCLRDRPWDTSVQAGRGGDEGMGRRWVPVTPARGREPAVA